MNWQTIIDPEMSGRLCLTLLHSVWQAALLAVVARGIESCWGRRSVDKTYALYVVALFIALAALPITYSLVDVARNETEGAASAALVVGIDVQPSALSLAKTPQLPDIANLAAPPAATPSKAIVTEASSSNWAQIAPWVALVYSVGVLVMLVRLAVGVYRAQRLSAHAEVVHEGPFVDLLHSLARDWSMRIVPALARAEKIVVPKVVGLVRPTILLPASAMIGLSPQELEMVLAHELAHIKRYDMWINLAQRLAEAALFFNPALWYLSRRISALREFCCDELTCGAMAQSHTDPRTRYAWALMRVVELSQRAPDTSNLAALATSGSSPSELRRRIARLFGEPLREPLRLSRGGVLTIAVLSAVLLAGFPAWRSAASSAEPDKNKAATGDADSNRMFELQVVGPDGKPVPQAAVEIRVQPRLTAKQVLRGEFVKASSGATIAAKADDDGRLVLEIPPKPEWFIVNIENPGYGPYWAEWNSGDHPQAIPNKFVAELNNAWSIGGLIVDSDGKPIEGATIHPSVKYKKRPGDHEDLGGGKRLTTAADGKWSFHSVPDSAAEVFVEISHPEFMPERRSLTRSEFGLKEGGKPVSHISLKRGVTITGTVTDDAGKPIAGALIRTKFMNDIREAKTGNDGSYRMIGCEPRMARIVVSAKSRALELKEVRVEPDMAPVDFALKPGGHLRVRALDEQGNPIPKTRIFFQRWRGPIDYFEFDHVSQYADERGVWEWNEAPFDEIKADICRPDGMQLSEQSLIARDEDYVFRPPPALVVSGSVIDAQTKKLIKRFRVIPGLRNSDPRIGMNWIPRDSYEASEGQYRIRLTNAYIAHLVRIEADDYQVAISRDIKTDEGNVTINFQLQPAEDIAATVLSATGKAAGGAKIALGVAGSQINIQNGDIDDGSTYASRLDADKAGRFSFPGRDEPFQLVITHAAGFAYLKSNEGPIPSEISLTPWARVEGVFRVGAKPVANIALYLNSDLVHSYGDDVPNIFTSHETTTSLDGRFVFDRVFPGEGRIGRRIIFMVDDGATEVTSSKMMPVQLSAGETAHADLGGDGRPVVGRLEPPANFNEKVLWNFATMRVGVPLPQLKTPPVPAAVQNDPQRRQAWWREWQLTDEGRTWQGMYEANERMRKASPYFTVSIDRDGTFRIDDMSPGNYTLSVGFDHRHAGGQLQNYKFSVPSGDENQSAQPIDLGVLTLDK